MNTIDNAYYAMDEALRDPAAQMMEFYLQKIDTTGLQRPTIEDLERLQNLMAKAAHLYRLHDGPAPTGWADTWKGAAARCAAVCRRAAPEYALICADKGQPISGAVRDRLNTWNYMGNLFTTWPGRDLAIKTEPFSITEAAGILPVEDETKTGEGKPLYYLKPPYDCPKLARIFDDLVAAGYIDGNAPAQSDFFRVFDQETTMQGHIKWIRKGRNRMLNKRAICDFLNLFGIPSEKWHDYAAAIFGVEVKPPTISNAIGGSADRDELRTIIDG